MNSRIQGVIAWCVLALCAAVSWAQPIDAQTKERILERIGELLDTRAYAAGVDFRRWPELRDARKDAMDRAEDSNAFVREVNRALRGFGISHLRVLTPRAAANRRSTTAVGVGLSARRHDDGLWIVSVVEGGPADEAGLEAGDLILSVNGEPVDATDALGGEAGTQVTLRVRRAEPGAPGGEPEREIILTRREYSTRRPETLTHLAPDAAVLRLPTFGSAYDRNTVEGLFRDAADLSFLVIDLRANGGGSVSNMTHFLGMLLPAGSEVGTSISKAVARDFARETDGDETDAAAIAAWSRQRMKVRRNALEPFKGRVAVLINRGSGSASEIVAAAMRELRDAALAGSPSAGSVLVSSHVKLADGFELQVPVSDYVTIRGRRLEGRPLEPDVRLSPARRGEPDDMPARALEHLRASAPREPAAEVESPARP